MLADLKYKFYSLLANQCLTRIGCRIYNIKLSFYILSRKTRLQMTRSIMNKNLLTSNTKVDSSNSTYYLQNFFLLKKKQKKKCRERRDGQAYF